MGRGGLDSALDHRSTIHRRLAKVLLGLLLLRGIDATGRRHAARRHRQFYFVAHHTGKPRGRARCVTAHAGIRGGQLASSRSYRDSRLCVAAFGIMWGLVL